MENIKRVLLTAVKCFLLGEQLPEGLIEPCDDSFLLSLFKAADRHEIAPILSEMLYKSKALGEGSEAAKCFKQSQLEAFYRCSKQQIEIERMSVALNEEKLPFILLKGSVVRQFYPESYLRTSCDIDVLVTPKTLDKAAEILAKKLGYKLVGRGFHDVQFVSESGVHIELHFSLVEDDKMPEVAEVLSDVWSTAKSQNGGYGCRMTNEMFLFYHIAHMAKHFVNGGCGIRSFIDLWLIRKNMPVDEAGLFIMLKKANLLEFYNSSVSLSEAWFSNKKPTELDCSMEEYIITGGVYGSSKNTAAVRKVQGKSRGKLLLGLVFYPVEILKEEYPVLNKHPWLMPLYQVKRWFRIFDKEKRQKVVKIYKASGSATEQQVESVAELLEKLNLK